MARGIADGSLFGAPLSGPGISLIDATYSYRFGRLAGKLPANTFGGYPTPVLEQGLQRRVRRVGPGQR